MNLTTLLTDERVNYATQILPKSVILKARNYKKILWKVGTVALLVGVGTPPPNIRPVDVSISAFSTLNHPH